MNSSPSNYAGSVDSVMLFIIITSLVMLVGVTVAMIYFVIKYNRKRNPKATNIEGNTKLEIIWIVIPTILVLFMFYFGYAVFHISRVVPENSYHVSVTARMWAWEFSYPSGKKTDTLYIPVQTPIKFTLKTNDVNHSFYIPAFRIKEDVMAGRENYMVLTADKLGTFDIACAEYCGMNHSLMYTKVHVIPQDQFYDWVNTGIEKDNPNSAETNNKQ